MTDEEALKALYCEVAGRADCEFQLAGMDCSQCMDAVWKSARSALRERIERRNGGWISVKDRLPKDGEAVMIFIKKKQGMREVIPGVFHRETCWNGETREWWNACGRSCPSDSIICWKAFPAPPEQEEPHD